MLTRARYCVRTRHRPHRDWVDIDSVLGLDEDIDVAEVLRWVGRIAGDEDPRYERAAAKLARR